MVLFCERCHQQRLICQALLYPNSVGNTSAFRSFQIAPQIPATHHLTLPPLVLNLIFPLTRVTILVVLAFQPLDQLQPTRPAQSAHPSTHRTQDEVRVLFFTRYNKAAWRATADQVDTCLSCISQQTYSTRMRNAKSPTHTFIVTSK